MAFFADPVSQRLFIGKVGPKGYIHGWHFVGVPGVGDDASITGIGHVQVTDVSRSHAHVTDDAGKTYLIAHDGSKSPVHIMPGNVGTPVDATRPSGDPSRGPGAGQESQFRRDQRIIMQQLAAARAEARKDPSLAAATRLGTKDGRAGTPRTEQEIMDRLGVTGDPEKHSLAYQDAYERAAGKDMNGDPVTQADSGLRDDDPILGANPKPRTPRGTPETDARAADRLVMHGPGEAANMGGGDLRAAEREFTRRAALLGKPGTVTRNHQAVRDEMKRRGLR